MTWVLGGAPLRAVGAEAREDQVTLSYPPETLRVPRGERVCRERINPSRDRPKGMVPGRSGCHGTATGAGGGGILSRRAARSPACAKQSEWMWSQLSLRCWSPCPRSRSPLAGPGGFTEALTPSMAPRNVGAGHHLSQRAMAFACNWEDGMDLASAGETIPAAR